jgi:hypothetical protein
MTLETIAPISDNPIAGFLIPATPNRQAKFPN